MSVILVVVTTKAMAQYEMVAVPDNSQYAAARSSRGSELNARSSTGRGRRYACSMAAGMTRQSIQHAETDFGSSEHPIRNPQAPPNRTQQNPIITETPKAKAREAL